MEVISYLIVEIYYKQVAFFNNKLEHILLLMDRLAACGKFHAFI